MKKIETVALKALKVLIITAMPLILLADTAPEGISGHSLDSMRRFKESVRQQIYFIMNEQNRDVYRPVKIDLNPALPKQQTATKKKDPKPEPTVVFNTKSYDFSKTTPYGNFKVNVIEYEKSFKVSFASQAPIQSYQLIDSETKITTAKGSVNDVMSYSFTVEKGFKPLYVLILAQYKDDFLSTNIIPLYQKTEVKTRGK